MGVVCIILTSRACQRVFSVHARRIFNIQVENLRESFTEREINLPGMSLTLRSNPSRYRLGALRQS